MRKEIYEMLCERLNEVGGGAIKHIDLWNHNVEFIEQEEQWERPAVFVEFCPIEWKPVKQGLEWRSDVMLRLHVVTDWQGGSSASSEWRDRSLEVFDLLDEIHAALEGASGECFSRMTLVSSVTNHNHEELIENIECFRCVGMKRIEE